MGESRGRTSRGQQIRRTHRWKQLCAELRATLAPICTYEGCDCPTGRVIDLTLPARHRWSWSLDHIHELEDGGDPYDTANLRPLHLRCNARKGRARQAARTREAIRLRGHRREFQCLNPSRQW